MRLARRSLALAPVAVLTTWLAACDVPPQPNPQVPDAGPAELNKLSEHGATAVSDIVRAPDGTLHALYLEEHSTHHRHQVYHRASTDGGRSWSTIQNLTEDAPEARAGMVRLAVDGQGRVYAFYWLHPSWASAAAGVNIGGSELEKGTLTYKVFEGGGWSDAMVVGRENQTYSWFPATDPTGQLHVLWVENSTDGQYDFKAGRIMQASVNGGAVADAQQLHEASLVPYSPGSEVVYQDSFQGLRGYVDATGTAHWIASRKPHDGIAEKREIVYSAGDEPTALFPESRFDGVYLFLRQPPQLIRDAKGQDHVLLIDGGGERPAVKDFAVPGGQVAAVLSQATDPKGRVLSFQATAGADGKALAFVGLNDTGATGAEDMFLVRFDGRQWGAPSNVTQNEARAARQNRVTGDTVLALTRFVPRFGAGILGPDGKASLVLVNDELTSMKGGTASEAHAYYVQR
jgi:hypothetical protein